MRSATPEMALPPKLWPTSTTSLRSSHLSTLAMSVMKTSRSMDLDNRCERSPSPVCVGASTVWPRPRRIDATLLQHQPPCQAPCTSTKVFDVTAALPGAAPAAARTAVVARNDRRSMKPSLMRARPSRLHLGIVFTSYPDCQHAANRRSILTVSDVVHPAAVHRQRLCGDPARLRRDQERDRIGDVLRFADAAHHGSCGETLLRPLPIRGAAAALRHVGAHEARRHCVHADAVRTALHGNAPRQNQHLGRACRE